MFKKIFNPKRKRQDPGRHNTSKITMDPASTAILSRHFSPLSSQAKSPSDILDIVGYPLSSNRFTQSSPELILYSTPLQMDNSMNEPQVKYTPRRRLTIRNNTTPPPQSPNQHDILLAETSREDKTLVEDPSAAVTEDQVEGLDETKNQVLRLQQRLLEFEKEREDWKQRLQGYMIREEHMRQIIHENQTHILQLKNMYHTPSRHNSYHTTSTYSSWLTDEEEDDDDEDEDEQRIAICREDDRYAYHRNHYYDQPYYPYNNKQGTLKRRYSSYYTPNNHNNAYYPRRTPYY